jgi:hypothetical protein
MRGVPLACWCRQQRCLALSFGLLLVSSSSFVLSLTPPFSVLSFIYFRCTDFVGVGIDIRNCKSALLGLLFLFASHSPNCFCFLVTFYLYLVSLSITCRNWNIRNRNCKSALLGLFSFFLQVALLIVFRFCILSSSCFLVTPFILRCCSEIEM